MSADGTEYLLPDGIDVAAIRDGLSAHLEIETDPVRSPDRTFYDTFDGRLHARGLLLVHEKARLALLDSAYGEQAAISRPRRPRSLLAAELPVGRLRERLAPVVEVRSLAPIARTRSRLFPLRALNEDAKTVVRLAVEEPAVVNAHGERTRLRSRLHVTGVRGYGKALAAVRRMLEVELGLPTADEPLYDESVRAAGGTPGGTSSKLAFVLRPDQRADAAATVLLVHLSATIERNLPGTLADVDSEFLHDLRVAVRRTRSAQRQLRAAFPPEPLAGFRAEFRRLQQITGPTRDLDVYVQELDSLAAEVPGELGADLRPLRDLLSEHRRRERRRMVKALRSARTTAVLADWGAFLESLVAAPLADRPEADRPIIDVAAERIHAVYRRMAETGGAIDDASPPEALHELRKQGKELRYLLEFFAGLYPGKLVKPMVTELKALQDTLGRFQDREVQANMLRSLRDEVAARDDGPAGLMAMGLLVDRLGREQQAARSEFGERFAAFVAKPRRKRIEEAFG